MHWQEANDIGKLLCHVRTSSVRSALRQTPQQTNKKSPLAVPSTQVYLNFANTTPNLPAYCSYSTWPSATKMPKKSYAEEDDGVFHDAPDAPKSNRAYTTGAKDPFPVMDDEKPVEDPIKPGMDDTDRQIRTSYRDIATLGDRANPWQDATRRTPWTSPTSCKGGLAMRSRGITTRKMWMRALGWTIGRSRSVVYL